MRSIFKLSPLLAAVAAFFIATAPASHAAYELGTGVCETTTTTGSGTVNLGGAYTTGGITYLTFVSQITSGNTVPYTIQSSDGKFEHGTGTFTDATPDTLSRSAAFSSDGVGTTLTLPAGTHIVCLQWGEETFTGELLLPAFGASGSFTQTDAGAVGVVITGHHDSATPADGDIALEIDAQGGADDEVIGQIQLEVDDGSTTTEDTRWTFYTRLAGADLDILDLSGVDGSTFNSIVIAYSSSAGATGRTFDFRHDSSSPADGDIPGEIRIFAGADDEEVGQIRMELDDGATGSEDTQWQHVVRRAGSDITALSLGTTGPFGTYAHVFDGGSNDTHLVIQDTNAGVDGPSVVAYQNSATPAASDYPGAFVMAGEDSASNATVYGSMATAIVDTTDTSEDSRIELTLLSGGSDLTALTLGTTGVGGVAAHEFNHGGASFGALQITNTHASDGPILVLNNNQSASDGDRPGTLAVYGDDEGGTEQEWMNMRVVVDDSAAASEDVQVQFLMPIAGSSAQRMAIGNGVIIGTGTTFPGAGGVFVDGILTVGNSPTGLSTWDSDAIAAPAVQNLGDDSNSSSIGTARYQSNASGPWFLFGKSRSSTVGTNSVVLDGDTIGVVSFQGADGTNLAEGARIRSFVDGSPGSGDMPGRIEFQTSPDAAAAPVVNLTIKNTGRLISTTGQVSHYWVYWTANSTTILASHNVTGIDDDATGDAGINLTTAFSSNNYAAFVTTNDTTNGWDNEEVQSSGINVHTTATVDVLCSTITDGTTAATSLTDPDQWQSVGFGVSS